jgi:hypothetical protein
MCRRWVVRAAILCCSLAAVAASSPPQSKVPRESVASRTDDGAIFLGAVGGLLGALFVMWLTCRVKARAGSRAVDADAVDTSAADSLVASCSASSIFLVAFPVLLLCGVETYARSGAASVAAVSLGAIAHTVAAAPRRETCATCSLTEPGSNVTVRIRPVHPKYRSSYGFGDGLGQDPWIGSHVTPMCGVYAFFDVVDVRTDNFVGREILLRRAPLPADAAPLPPLVLTDMNVDDVLSAAERSPQRAARCGAAPTPDAGGDAGFEPRPIFYWIDTELHTAFGHWEAESVVFLDRWACLRAHFPGLKLMVRAQRHFKTLLAGLYGIADSDIVAAPLPCDGGNVVLLPPTFLLNQWDTDLAYGQELLERFFKLYATQFGHPTGCAARNPRGTDPGSLVALPRGHVENFASHDRGVKNEDAVLAMLEELGAVVFRADEVNDAGKQIDTLRRARVIVTHYGSALFHNLPLARGATMFVLADNSHLHHEEMPAQNAVVTWATTFNKLHVVLGVADVAKLRALIKEELDSPPLPCPTDPATRQVLGGCAVRGCQFATPSAAAAPPARSRSLRN